LKIADIQLSGILSIDEHVSNFYQGTQYPEGQRLDGIIILTDRRFLFVIKPPGLFTKGFDVILSARWQEVLSLSTTGLIFKKLRLSIQTPQGVNLQIFSSDNLKDVVETMLFNKNLLSTSKVNMDTVVIEEADRCTNEISVKPKKQ
jgi:hypothetical protein